MSVSHELTSMIISDFVSIGSSLCAYFIHCKCIYGSNSGIFAITKILLLAYN